MKRFISVILTLAMVFALLPAMLVSADDTTATMEWAGVRIQYPTFTDGAGGRVSPFSAVGDITYGKSGQRVELISGTVAANSTSIRRGALSFFSYNEGLYGAYKIRVPKAGKYNITVEYRADSVGDTSSKMYILPISAKDSIATEIATREPDATVNFNGELLNTNQPFAQYKISPWPAPQAGEYIVVWVASAGSARMNPANLIFDGCNETEADALIGEISLSDTELVAGEKATIIPELYNGYTGDAVSGTVTYSSSDSNVLSVDGTTVTAKKPGTATVYAEAAGCGNKVALDVKVYAANMSGVCAQYPLVEGMYGNKDIVKPNNITYAISGHRIDWFDYTGTYGGTTPSWNSQTARFMLKSGQYAAYKINVPAKGFYNVTLEYLVSTGDNSKADMYLLPGNTKKEDILTALESVDPVFGDVDFLYSNHQGVSAGDILTYETGFDAKTAGEYLVVWKSNRLGAVRPKNLIFNGCKEGEEKNGIVGEITLSDTELVVGESATAEASLNDAYTGAAVTSAVTYSCDSDVLSVNGTTVTANKAGNATLYASVEGYPNKVAFDVTVAAPAAAQPQPEAAPTEISYGVFDNIASVDAVTVSGGEDNKLFGKVAAGTGIEATANDMPGYKFRYWVLGSAATGRYYSSEKTVVVNPYANIALTAIYTEAAEETKFIDFFNWNGEFVDSKEVTDGKITALPTQPSLIGYSFINWILEDNTTTFTDTSVEISENISRAMAQYNVVGNYDTPVEKKNSATGWTRNGKLVTYSNDYEFFTWLNNVGEIAEYNGEAIADKIPLAVLENSGKNFMLEYDKGDYTIKEAGILFGKTETVDVASAYSKATVKNIKAHGQLTAAPEGDVNMELYARGYVMYGNKVIYTDAIEVTYGS